MEVQNISEKKDMKIIYEGIDNAFYLKMLKNN